MSSYYLKLIKKQQIAKGTYLFSFERPKDFAFIPGQHIGIGFEKLIKPDPIGNIKLFSIVNSGKEKTLDVIMRMRDSGFKQTMNRVKPGQKVYIEGPYGQFTLHLDQKIPAVFIAGGVGLAPVRCIIKEAVDNKQKYKIDVFYSDRTLENTIYLDEFNKWSNDKKIRFFLTLTSPVILNESASEESRDPSAVRRGGRIQDDIKKKWSGLIGRINKKMLQDKDLDFKKSIFYIAGSPEMVFDIKDMLLELGVKPQNIKTEEFAGY